MDYEVLSPWAEVDTVEPKGIAPRLSDLNGKTIGLMCYFKPAGPPIMAEIDRQLKARFPDVKVSHWRYHAHPCEVIKDPVYKDSFREWVNSVDAVVSGHGD